MKEGRKEGRRENMKSVIVFWVVMPCSLLDGYNSEEGGSTLCRNTDDPCKTRRLNNPEGHGQNLHLYENLKLQL
jgi:hypothetical protein